MSKNKKENILTLNSEGFTFIEVLVVIIIICLLGSFVWISLFNSFEKAKVESTKTQIKGLATALDLYRLHNSKYPSSEQSLKALLKKPEIGIIPERWNGPYLNGKNLPKDAWGNQFVYLSKQGREFKIISLGADGVEGGADLDKDINSDEL